MPRLSPVSRRELIQRLQKLGFDGPYTGAATSLCFAPNGDSSCLTLTGEILAPIYWFVSCVRQA